MTTNLLHLAFVGASALCLTVGCSDGSDSGGSGGGGGAGGGAGGGDPTSCGAVGTWIMTSVFCGNNDVTSDLSTQGGIDGMQLEITAVAGGCHLVGTFTGPTCTETEEREAKVESDGTFTEVSSVGITSCEPAMCTFNANDAPCVLGDRAGPSTSTTATVQGDTLVVTSEPPAGLCNMFGLTTIITYARQ